MFGECPCGYQFCEDPGVCPPPKVIDPYIPADFTFSEIKKLMFVKYLVWKGKFSEQNVHPY